MRKFTQQTNLLYITRMFPESTFIEREILEMSRYKDLNLRIIYFAKVGGFISLIPHEMKRKFLYVKPNLPKLLAFNVITFVRSPVKYSKLAILLLRVRRNHRFIKRFRDFRFLFIGAMLAQEIRNFDVDHIHAHLADWPTTIALVLSCFLDVPFTFTAHASDVFADPRLLKEKISLAEAVITCTKFNQKYLIDISSPDDRNKIFPIYHGVNFKDFPFSRKRKANKVPLILAVGRLVPFKGFDYLVDALDIVKRQGKDFRAVIIGGGREFQKLRKMVTKRDLIRNVKLLGALNFKEVKKYLGKADILVAPSVIELRGRFYTALDGIPNTLIEAMAAKVPIVSTWISGIPEAVKDGENGLLVEEKDAKALAEAIQTLLNDRKLREQFGEAGSRRAQEMFDLRKNVKRLKQVILNEKGWEGDDEGKL